MREATFGSGLLGHLAQLLCIVGSAIVLVATFVGTVNGLPMEGYLIRMLSGDGAQPRLEDGGKRSKRADSGAASGSPVMLPLRRDLFGIEPSACVDVKYHNGRELALSVCSDSFSGEERAVSYGPAGNEGHKVHDEIYRCAEAPIRDDNIKSEIQNYIDSEGKRICDAGDAASLDNGRAAIFTPCLPGNYNTDDGRKRGLDFQYSSYNDAVGHTIPTNAHGWFSRGRRVFYHYCDPLPPINANFPLVLNRAGTGLDILPSSCVDLGYFNGKEYALSACGDGGAGRSVSYGIYKNGVITSPSKYDCSTDSTHPVLHGGKYKQIADASQALQAELSFRGEAICRQLEGQSAEGRRVAIVVPCYPGSYTKRDNKCNFDYARYNDTGGYTIPTAVGTKGKWGYRISGCSSKGQRMLYHYCSVNPTTTSPSGVLVDDYDGTKVTSALWPSSAESAAGSVTPVYATASTINTGFIGTAAIGSSALSQSHATNTALSAAGGINNKTIAMNNTTTAAFAETSTEANNTGYPDLLQGLEPRNAEQQAVAAALGVASGVMLLILSGMLLVKCGSRLKKSLGETFDSSCATRTCGILQEIEISADCSKLIRVRRYSGDNNMPMEELATNHSAEHAQTLTGNSVDACNASVDRGDNVSTAEGATASGGHKKARMQELDRKSAGGNDKCGAEMQSIDSDDDSISIEAPLASSTSKQACEQAYHHHPVEGDDMHDAEIEEAAPLLLINSCTSSLAASAEQIMDTRL